MNNNKRFITAIIGIMTALLITLGTGLSVYAAEEADITVSGDTVEEGLEKPIEGGENSGENTENTENEASPSQNIFDGIYSLAEENADKIFSALAFIGTLVISLGYKSGLIPLLDKALSTLKGSVEEIREASERSCAESEDKIRALAGSVDGFGSALASIDERLGDYEEVCRDRERMRLIMEGQMDMLYAIFMTSSLPQYQKDEIGQRMARLREELGSYEGAEK